MDKIEIAFIGGSGLYKINELKNISWISKESEFGTPSSKICVGTLNGKKIAFLPRHGKDHSISPTKINYRANIDILKQLNVQNIVSLSAVGSLREDYIPGDFVIVNQFIDKTYLREKTFFDEGIVAHIPFKDPTCQNLNLLVAKCLEIMKIKFHETGTYICIEGPQFSTLAESQLYRSWGCDVIGMTNQPEAKLSMEAGICYSSVAMVTDFDCWHPDHDNVTIEQIIKTLENNSGKANKLISELSKQNNIKCNDDIKNLSRNSIVTDLSKSNKVAKNRLKNILSSNESKR